MRADAAQFSFARTFGLVVSTYDALNHLPGLDALAGCFRSVQRVLLPGGYFIFDLNTRLGLKRWNGIQVDDSRSDLLTITRGFFVEDEEKAWTRHHGLCPPG